MPMDGKVSNDAPERLADSLRPETRTIDPKGEEVKVQLPKASVPLFTRPPRALVASIQPPSDAYSSLLPSIKPGNLPKEVKFRLSRVADLTYLERSMPNIPDAVLDPVLGELNWVLAVLGLLPQYIKLLTPPSSLVYADMAKTVELPPEYLPDLGAEWLLDGPDKQVDLTMGPRTRASWKAWKDRGLAGVRQHNIRGNYAGDIFPVAADDADVRVFALVAPLVNAYIRHGRAPYEYVFNQFKALLTTDVQTVGDMPADKDYQAYWFTALPGTAVGPEAGRGFLQGPASAQPSFVPGLFSNLVNNVPAFRLPIQKMVSKRVLAGSYPFTVETTDATVTAMNSIVGARALEATQLDALASGMSEANARAFVPCLLAACMGTPMEVTFDTTPSMPHFLEAMLYMLLPPWALTERSWISVKLAYYQFLVLFTEFVQNPLPVVMINDRNKHPFVRPPFPDMQPALGRHVGLRGAMREYGVGYGAADRVPVPAELGDTFVAGRNILMWKFESLDAPDGPCARAELLAEVINQMFQSLNRVKAAAQPRVRGLAAYFQQELLSRIPEFLYGINVLQQVVAYDPLALPDPNMRKTDGNMVPPFAFASALRLASFPLSISVIRPMSSLLFLPSVDDVLTRHVTLMRMIEEMPLPAKYKKPRNIRKAVFDVMKPLYEKFNLAWAFDPRLNDLALIRDVNGVLVPMLDDGFRSPFYALARPMIAILREAYEEIHTVSHFFIDYGPHVRRQVTNDMLRDRTEPYAVTFTSHGADSPVLAELDYLALCTHMQNRTFMPLVARARQQRARIRFNIRVPYTLLRLESAEATYSVRDRCPFPLVWSDQDGGRLSIRPGGLIIPYAFRVNIDEFTLENLNDPMDLERMAPLYTTDVPPYTVPGQVFMTPAQYAQRFTAMLFAYNLADADMTGRRVLPLQPEELLKGRIYTAAGSIEGTSLPLAS